MVVIFLRIPALDFHTRRTEPSESPQAVTESALGFYAAIVIFYRLPVLLLPVTALFLTQQLGKPQLQRLRKIDMALFGLTEQVAVDAEVCGFLGNVRIK